MAAAEDSSVIWLESLRSYICDPDSKILDLESLNLEAMEVQSILEFLANSEICELNLSDNKLEGQMVALSELLVKTKIRKLNVSKCKLSTTDVLSLTSILKDSRINDLNISKNMFKLSGPESNEFTSFLAESHLTSLNLRKSAEFQFVEEAMALIRVLCKSSITNLNLDYLNKDGKLCSAIMVLFHNLEHSKITHLSLYRNSINTCRFFTFGDGLRKSKLIDLGLGRNGLIDRHLSELFEALIGTQITSLNLSKCLIDYSDNFFQYLDETQIRRLDLSSSFINDDVLYNFPNYLSGSSVVSLNLGSYPTPGTEGKIIEHLRSSKLEEVGFNFRYLSHASIFEFCRAIKQSSITSVIISGRFDSRTRENRIKFTQFVGLLLKNSNVTTLKLRFAGFYAEAARMLFPNIVNSKLSRLDLSHNILDESMQSIVLLLKFTALTDLNLRDNGLNDDDVEVLAECLQETRLINLNLGYNQITDSGAQCLALSLENTNILCLNLEYNQIKNPGMRALAEYAATTIIFALKVGGNPGDFRIVETVTYKNRRSVLEKVRFFKQIAPEPGTKAFRFEGSDSTMDVDSFLEECLSLYYLAIKRPSLCFVLSRCENISLVRDEIDTLLLEEFPRQLVQFIATAIEAEISEHIDFLKKAEEMGLDQIVELLLLNRPVYLIDVAHGILHPYVYRLLNKYRLPICNLDIEPGGLERILEYFIKFPNIEGADEAIKMLTNIMNSIEAPTHDAGQTTHE